MPDTNWLTKAFAALAALVSAIAGHPARSAAVMALVTAAWLCAQRAQNQYELKKQRKQRKHELKLERIRAERTEKSLSLLRESGATPEDLVRVLVSERSRETESGAQ